MFRISIKKGKNSLGKGSASERNLFVMIFIHIISSDTHKKVNTKS